MPAGRERERRRRSRPSHHRDCRVPFLRRADNARLPSPERRGPGMPHSERLAAWRARAGADVTAEARDSRERKVIAAVACSYCGAGRGSPCVRNPGSSITTLPHPERKDAWKRARGPGDQQNAPVICSCGHGAGQHSSHGCEKCACMRSKSDLTSSPASRPMIPRPL